MYYHLLGLRAVTFFRTGKWDMPKHPNSRCTLSNFTLQLASVLLPHNQVAKEICVSHFIRAVRAKLYSIQCIGGTSMNQEKLGRVFKHILNVHTQIQSRYASGKDHENIYQQQRSIAIKIGVRSFI